MTIEEILKDIEENRLTNPRVAVVKTLEACAKIAERYYYSASAQRDIQELITEAKK